MSKNTQATPALRKVWRITEAAPQGEFVTLPAGTHRVSAAVAPAGDLGWWLSSADLEKGASVTEFVWDRFPPEVLAVYRRS